MSDMTDPFEDPTPRVSAFASADSFRGRVVLIEPTRVERDVPKSNVDPNGARGDKITANVTVLDGKGPVQVYSQKVPTGRYLDGPVHRGVWFNQEQITQGLQLPDGKTLRKRVLVRLETLKPGGVAGPGNPWTINPVSAEEKSAAAQELARIQLAEQDVDPFAPAADKAPF